MVTSSKYLHMVDQLMISLSVQRCFGKCHIQDMPTKTAQIFSLENVCLPHIHTFLLKTCTSVPATYFINNASNIAWKLSFDCIGNIPLRKSLWEHHFGNIPLRTPPWELPVENTTLGTSNLEHHFGNIPLRTPPWEHPIQFIEKTPITDCHGNISHILIMNYHMQYLSAIRTGYIPFHQRIIDTILKRLCMILYTLKYASKTYSKDSPTH